MNAVKARIGDVTGRILREARFVGIRAVIGMQRPDATVFDGEMKQNLGNRVLCGSADNVARGMALRNAAEAPLALKGARGRAIIETETADAEQVQVYFVPVKDAPALLTAAGIPHATPLPKAPRPEPDDEGEEPAKARRAQHPIGSGVSSEIRATDPDRRLDPETGERLDPLAKTNRDRHDASGGARSGSARTAQDPRAPLTPPPLPTDPDRG